MMEILRILEELSSDEMAKFKHMLRDHGIPFGRLEYANVMQVFDLIKNQFPGEDQRFQVTAISLKGIMRFDLVKRLNAFQGGVEPNEQAKQSNFKMHYNARSSSIVRQPQEQRPKNVPPINTRNAGEGVPTSGERPSKDYGRDAKLRNPSILLIVLGFIIIIMATTAALTMSQRPLVPLRVPWWSGVLLSVVGIIPLLPLRKRESVKLTVILLSNIFGSLVALIALGLSIWNGIEETADAKDCTASYHWIIIIFAAMELCLSLWIIGITSFWLRKERKTSS